MFIKSDDHDTQHKDTILLSLVILITVLEFYLFLCYYFMY